MDITEWSDIDFMQPTIMDKHLTGPEYDKQTLTKRFQQRQEEFFARCMATLKYAGST